jgi:hypothetical protein
MTPIQAVVRLESTPVRCGVTPWSIRARRKAIYGDVRQAEIWACRYFI